MKKLVFVSLIILSLFTACHNQDNEFPDYKYTTVYFPYQSPVRTIELGKDIYDNTLDKAHKCKIMATMGGVYENSAERTLNILVDNSLCDSVKFDTDSGKAVIPMPSNYYSLASDMKIVIPAGSISGGIEVQLTDAFFADAHSVENTFVIPLRIASVVNADSVLSGKSLVEDPNRLIASDWSVTPKDYILYCVKYINPWHGSYLRRGKDTGTGNTGDTTIIYHNQYVERDQVVSMKTISMSEVSMALITRNKGDMTDIPFELRITVDNEGKCSVSNPDAAGYTITGTGEFVSDGDMWGSQKRDVMHLNYSVDFGTAVHTFSDTLVIRDRGVKFELFNPIVKK